MTVLLDQDGSTSSHLLLPTKRTRKLNLKPGGCDRCDAGTEWERECTDNVNFVELYYLFALVYKNRSSQSTHSYFHLFFSEELS